MECMVTTFENLFRNGHQRELTAAGSPWQVPFVELLIGSVAGMSRSSLCWEAAPEMDFEKVRPILPRFSKSSLLGKGFTKFLARPPVGQIVAIAEVGGLHHRYERAAA